MKFDPYRPSTYTPFIRRFTDERAKDLADTIELYGRIKITDGEHWENVCDLLHINHVSRSSLFCGLTPELRGAKSERFWFPLNE